MHKIIEPCPCLDVFWTQQLLTWPYPEVMSNVGTLNPCSYFFYLTETYPEYIIYCFLFICIFSLPDEQLNFKWSVYPPRDHVCMWAILVALMCPALYGNTVDIVYFVRSIFWSQESRVNCMRVIIYIYFYFFMKWKWSEQCHVLQDLYVINSPDGL